VSDLHYPIGRFEAAFPYTKEQIADNIARLADFPARIAPLVTALTDPQLDTPYRPGGWTVRQVVHHVADSHINAYIRTKWTLSEESPVIKPYLEKEWAKTAENQAPVQLSLHLITALHAKWVTLLRALPQPLFEKSYYHPDTKKQVRLDTLVATYAWHGEHHAMHIQRVKERMGW